MIDFIPQLIDIVLLMVLLVTAIGAWRNGFFTSVVNLVGSLGGLLIAWFASNNYSPIIFDKLLRKSLVNSTYKYLQNSTAGFDGQSMIQNFVGDLPSSFVDKLLTQAEGAIAGLNGVSMDVAEGIVDFVLGPIVILIIGVVIFVVCILGCKILVAFLAKALKIVNHIPVLGFANRLAGFAVGICIGGINILLISCLLSIIAIITQNTLSFLNIELLTQSKLLALTASINPFMG